MGVQKTIQQQQGQNNYKDNTATKQYNYKEIQQFVDEERFLCSVASHYKQWISDLHLLQEDQQLSKLRGLIN